MNTGYTRKNRPRAPSPLSGSRAPRGRLGAHTKTLMGQHKPKEMKDGRVSGSSECLLVMQTAGQQPRLRARPRTRSSEGKHIVQSARRRPTSQPAPCDGKEFVPPSSRPWPKGGKGVGRRPAAQLLVLVVLPERQVGGRPSCLLGRRSREARLKAPRGGERGVTSRRQHGDPPATPNAVQR